ncbi:phosphatidylinositol 4-phosphate 5-kinase-like protein 1 isoform X2 [Anas platyrhynchos]|uniref:phosphatidylinositol 4-phosphate 5-kinase-like protein 1 isoform X2 n=1 Tax=Anas platyrhynchos TaxID=8839 RepID=UPI003AF2EA4E
MAAVTEGTPASRPRAGGLRLSPRTPQQHKFGLFEIGPEHQFHLLTCRLRMGLRAATQAAIDHPPADTPCDSDFAAVLRQPHEGFELLTYAGPAFARLRRALGLPEELYQAALSSRYFQFVSNSKSKARFFLTQDKRFFLKTQTKQEMRLLLANLPRYLRHLEAFPHSLLVRLLGAHSIVVPRRSRAGAPIAALPCPQRYFTVTLSVFFPDEGILERYDIKGCSVDRWAEPASAVVLKDLNFEGKSLVLAGAGQPLPGGAAGAGLQPAAGRAAPAPRQAHGTVPGAVPRPAGLGAEPEPARRQQPPALHRRAAAALLGGAGGSLHLLHLPPAPRAPLEEDPLPGRVLLHHAPRCLRPAAVPVGGSAQRVTATLGARLKNPFLCQKLSGDLLSGMWTPPPRLPRSVPRNAALSLPWAEPRGALCPPRGVWLPVG